MRGRFDSGVGGCGAQGGAGRAQGGCGPGPGARGAVRGGTCCGRGAGGVSEVGLGPLAPCSLVTRAEGVVFSRMGQQMENTFFFAVAARSKGEHRDPKASGESGRPPQGPGSCGRRRPPRLLPPGAAHSGVSPLGEGRVREGQGEAPWGSVQSLGMMEVTPAAAPRDGSASPVSPGQVPAGSVTRAPFYG